MFSSLLLGLGLLGLQTAVSSDNSISNSENNETVKLELFYECLCPYSRDFYIGIFKDTVEDLLPYLDVHMYPFGNAKMTILNNGTVLFECQHGPRECYGNKLHSCAQDILKNITSVITFNACLMNDPSNSSTDDVAHGCGRILHVDPTPIIECARGERGVELLKANGEKSLKVKYSGVPWPLVNGVHNDNYDTFRDTVCKAFKNPPPQCL